MGETLNFNLHVYERDDIARLPFNLTVTTTANDTLPFALDLTKHDFLADPCRYAGAEVDYDRGDGVMVPLTDSEMPTSLSLHGSLDGFGVRELTFGRIGPGQTPLNSGSLRGAQRVKMSGIRGTLGGYRALPMFDGYLRDASYDSHPAAAAIVAQDASILNEPLFYTLAAQSASTRLAVITDICQRYGIKIGTFAFTDADNVGGYAIKEINEAGNRSVLAFLAEYVSPTGCRVYWRDGALNIKRFSTDDTPVRTLTFSDIRKVTVAPVPANTPNVVRMASEIYPFTGAILTGVQAPITTDVVNAVYAPVVAVDKQDHTTGVISATGLSSSAIMREVSKTVTTNTYDSNGTLTTWTVEKYTWYNPLACNLKQDGSGVTRYNEDFDVYRTADGVWHYQDQETYQVTDKRVFVALFSTTTGVKYGETETFYQYHDWSMPVGQRNAGNTATVYIANRYLTNDGQGWLNGRQRIDALPAPVTLNHLYTWDTATRSLIRRTTQGYFAAGLSLYNNMTFTSAGNLYVFGPTAVPMYGVSFGGLSAAQINEADTLTYTALTATTHREVNTDGILSYSNWWHVRFQDPEIGRAYAFTDTTVSTPLPKVSSTRPTQVTEPASVTAVDRVGVALLGKRNVTNTENSWCETTDEMDTVAFDVLRFSRAIPVRIEMDLDFDIVEGSVITLPPHPDLGQAEVDVLAMDCTWVLDQTAPGMGQLTVDALFFPPELAE